MIDAIMAADASKLPAVLGVDLGAQGYLVLRVLQVLPRDAAPGGDEALRGQFAQAWAVAEAEAYMAALKKRFKAEVTPGASLVSDSASAPVR